MGVKKMEGVISNGKVVPLDELYVEPTCTFAEFTEEDVLSPEKIKAAIKILEKNNLSPNFKSSISDGGWYKTYSEFGEDEGGEKMYLFRVCIVNTKTEQFDIVNVVTKNEITAKIKGFNASNIMGSIDEMQIEAEGLMSWNKE